MPLFYDNCQILQKILLSSTLFLISNNLIVSFDYWIKKNNIEKQDGSWNCYLSNVFRHERLGKKCVG